jgi:hypothetical protein
MYVRTRNERNPSIQKSGLPLRSVPFDELASYIFPRRARGGSDSLGKNRDEEAPEIGGNLLQRYFGLFGKAYVSGRKEYVTFR